MNKSFFRPGVLPTVLVILVVPLFSALGVWQLNRADEKRGLMEQQRARAQDRPFRLSDEITELGDRRYQPVHVIGVYDRSHQFLLDNRTFNGQAGYHVLTPFRIEGGISAVLVNRGWVPLNPDRRQLPDLPVPEDRVELAGTLDQFGSVGFKLKGAEIPTPGWPAVVQIVDQKVLSERIGYPLLPYQILLSPADPGGFQRAWQTIDLHPETSQGYALQWFSFAVTALALYGWYGFKFARQNASLLKSTEQKPE